MFHLSPHNNLYISSILIFTESHYKEFHCTLTNSIINSLYSQNIHVALTEDIDLCVHDQYSTLYKIVNTAEVVYSHLMKTQAQPNNCQYNVI